MENASVVITSLIVAGVIMSTAIIGACFGDSKVTTKFIEGITRQPEAKNALFTNTLISVGLVESMAIIGTVIVLILLYANPLLNQ